MSVVIVKYCLEPKRVEELLTHYTYEVLDFIDL